MALLFSSATHTVNVGTGIGSLADLTYWAWINPTAVDVSYGLFGKGTSGGGNRRTFEVRDTVTDDALFGLVDCAVTDAVSESAAGTVVSGVDQFVMMTYDGSATKTVRIYHGTRATAPSEVSYAIGPTAGSGAEGDNSGASQFIGSFGSGSSGGTDKHMSNCGIVNRVVTASERLELWSGTRFFVPGTLGLYTLGFPGTGSQRDWSGNGNHGTVTGAAESAHPPLRHPFQYRRRGRIYVPAAAAGDAVPQVWAQYRRRHAG